MRDKNFHMSIVIDEYGGTAGIVSLSRLMEEIFGPVGDDLSAAEKEFESINENTFQIDGSMRIESQCRDRLTLPEVTRNGAGFVLQLMGVSQKEGSR